MKKNDFIFIMAASVFLVVIIVCSGIAVYLLHMYKSFDRLEAELDTKIHESVISTEMDATEVAAEVSTEVEFIKETVFTEENGFTFPTTIVNFKGNQLEIGFTKNPNFPLRYFFGVDNHSELKDVSTGLYRDVNYPESAFISNGMSPVEYSYDLSCVYTKAEKECLAYIFDITGFDECLPCYNVPPVYIGNDYPYVGTDIVLPDKSVWGIVSIYDTAYCYDKNTEFSSYSHLVELTNGTAQDYIDKWSD